MHGREHREFNDRAAQLGYPTKQVERFTKKGLELRERIAPPKANLAATAALEHFTATLAEIILSDERARDMIGHEEVKNLFVWHALEESEHKAVAFDVYKAVGGTERMRVWTMKGIRLGFVLGMSLQVIISVPLDRDARRHPIKLWRSWRKLKSSPFLSRETWRTLKEYDAPDFHPDDRTPTSWSPAGAPSCSATPGPSTTSSRPEQPEGARRGRASWPCGRHHRSGVGHRPGARRRAGPGRHPPRPQRRRRGRPGRDRGQRRGLRRQGHLGPRRRRRPRRGARLGRRRSRSSTARSTWSSTTPASPSAPPSRACATRTSTG